MEESRGRGEKIRKPSKPKHQQQLMFKGDEFDPDLHDYRTKPARQLSPMVETASDEAAEREAKRLRVIHEEESGQVVSERTFDHSIAYMATEFPKFLSQEAKLHYASHEQGYMLHEVSQSQFLFGVKRKDFSERYAELEDSAMQAQGQAAAGKKKGRKEVRLTELSEEQRQLFTMAGGADEKEWRAWLDKEACEVMSLEKSEHIMEHKRDLVIPTRWVRANKSDGLVGAAFQAKSRLVVQGFKDKALGHYRRDAPTASAIAESICLAVCAFLGFTLRAKDIRNAYFSGKTVEREIYMSQPKGGLPGLHPKQLLKAKKAIYGFAEAARMFWLALREHLLSDGWVESRLEPALFYLRRGGQLDGILVAHVDDIEGGLRPELLKKGIGFEKSSKALEFATNHFKDFIFRGREVRQGDDGHIDISMKNYSLSMKQIKIDKQRKKQPRRSLPRRWRRCRVEQVNLVG